MSSIRKMGIAVGITGLVLAIASGTGFASFVTIIESASETGNTIATSDLNTFQIITPPAPETTSVTGNITPQNSSGPLILNCNTPAVSCVYNVVLTEPAQPGGTTTSELITLTVFPLIPATIQNPTAHQPVQVDFTSDTDPSALTAPAGAVSVTEVAGLMDISQYFGTACKTGATTSTPGTAPCLTITVQSEAAVPEPASLLLLGSGLVGLALWRRRHA